MQTQKLKYGRLCTIDPKIASWRKKQRRFRALKKELLSMIQAKGWDKAQVQHWLNTPTPALRQNSSQVKRNRTPKELLNPDSIGILHTWAKKVLV